MTAWQSQINLPSPLLNLISEAVKHQGEPVISSLLSQLATPLYLPLQPDQCFERVCCFHGSRPEESPLLEKRLGGNRISEGAIVAGSGYRADLAVSLESQPEVNHHFDTSMLSGAIDPSVGGLFDALWLSVQALAEVTGPWFFHSRSPRI